jgi:flagellar biosynthesis/type III secretory pathway M-ring protein FliF/YscJ
MSAESQGSPAQLPAAESAVQLGGVLKRVRQIAEQDVNLAAKVVRMWLQEGRA